MHLTEAIIMTRGHAWSSIGVGHNPIVLVNTAPNILNRTITFFPDDYFSEHSDLYWYQQKLKCRFCLFSLEGSTPGQGYLVRERIRETWRIVLEPSFESHVSAINFIIITRGGFWILMPRLHPQQFWFHQVLKLLGS